MVDYEASRSKYIIVFIAASFASNIAAKLGGLIFSESDYFNLAISTGEVEQAMFASSAISGLLAVGAWIAVFLMFQNIYFHRMLWYVIASYVSGGLVSFITLSKMQDFLGLTDTFLLQSALLSFAMFMTVPLFFYVLRKDLYYPPVFVFKNIGVTSEYGTTTVTANQNVSSNQHDPLLANTLEDADEEMYEIALAEPDDSSQNSFIYEKPLEEWITLAENGNNVAQYNLGIIYDQGLGAPQDYIEAVKWYQLAAEQGDAEAQNNLGSMYVVGRCLLQDNVLAHMWYNIASANGYFQAAEWRDEVAVRMSQDDISKAQTMARECLSSNYQKCGY